jgi:hypothetical protein
MSSLQMTYQQEMKHMKATTNELCLEQDILKRKTHLVVFVQNEDISINKIAFYFLNKHI